MGEIVINQNRQPKTESASGAANKTTLQQTQPVNGQNGFERLPLPSIQVTIHSNKREDLPYLIFPIDKGKDFDSSRTPMLVVNGMNMTSDAIFDMGQSMANKYGRSTLMIPNHTEGKVIDIRNCIASAFSSRIGLHLENGAAGHLASNLVKRLNDNESIDLVAYSQGTLITNNVLSELRTYLIQNGEEEVWDNFAKRIDLKTYGAAIHIWPEGIAEIKEYRHIGDPVAGPVGNTVTALNIAGNLAVGEMHSEFATQIKLPVFEKAHSILNYLGTSNFYLKELKGLDPETQVKRIVNSINKREFSADECNQIIQGVAQYGFTGKGNSNEVNTSIEVSRVLVKALVGNKDAALILTPETTDILTSAATRQSIERKSLIGPLFNRK